MKIMIPEEGRLLDHSRIVPPLCRVWLVTPALVGLLLLGCSRESDSAETTTTLHAQAQPQPQPRVVRRNLGYPYAQEAPSREAARLPAKVESRLPIYEIRMSPQHLEMMDMNPYAPELYPATFTAGGVVYEN